MTIAFYFNYGNRYMYPARFIYRTPDFMDTKLSTADIPVVCERQRFAGSNVWSPWVEDEHPWVFADAFSDLAYHFIQMQDALGCGPTSQVIVRLKDGKSIVYRKRILDDEEDIIPSRAAQITFHINSISGPLRWGPDTTSRMYEYLFRAAVVQLLRHEIVMRIGCGLKPRTPFYVLLARLKKTGALFQNAAAHGLTIYPQGPFA